MALNIENVQSAGYAEFGGVAHQLTITKPTGLAVGDLLVFILGLFGSSGTINEPSIPTGWTEAVELNGTTDERRYLTIMYKIANSSDVAASNFTFSSPSESGNIYGYGSLIRITGHHPTTPVKSALAQTLTTGSEVTSFNDATIPAGRWVWLETTAQSGTVGELSVSIEYTVD